MRNLLLALVLLLAGSSASALSVNLVAAIDESQTVPASGSVAFGTAVLTLDDVTNILSVSAVTTNVLLQGVELAAQIHFGAPGVNGAAWADLPLGPVKLSSLDLTLLAACAVLTDCTGPLLAGDTYILLTTEAFGEPQGEIRGQIVPVNGVAEPAVLGLLGLGMLGLGWAGRVR